MTENTVEQRSQVFEELRAQVKAMGAPGDYGYGTPAGEALHLAHKILAHVPRIDRISEIAFEIAAEVKRAEAKHPRLNSPHEGWSVIYEELEELREHVRSDTGHSAEARKEALQIAAMGLRYALNLCDGKDNG